MWADFSLQQVRIMRAFAFLDLESTPIMIEFENGRDGSHCSICLHLEDAALADALVRTINATIKQHAGKPEAA
jgi:hypothetical protein